MQLEAPIEGVWWAPGNEDAPVHGTLAFDDEDELTKLTARDPLGVQAVGPEPSTGFDPFDMPRLDLIHGHSSDGDEVTLVGGNCIHRSIPLGGSPRGLEVWRIEAVVLGSWLAHTDEPVTHVRVTLGSLHHWSGAPRPEMSVAADGQETTVTARTTDHATADVPGATVTLRSEHHRQLDIDSARVVQEACVTFTLDPGIGVRTVMNTLVLPTRDLLAFFVGGFVPVESVRVTLELPDDQARPRRANYITRLQQPYRLRPPRRRHEMLATLPTFGMTFDELLPAWFALRESQRTAITMLLVPSHAPYLYADSHLLTAWLACEAYHRHAIGGSAIPPRQHEARVEAIVQGAPAEHRAWAKNILSGKNNIGVARQLREIVTRATQTGAAILTAQPRFIDVAVSNRQHVAHPTELDPGAGARFLFLASALRWLIRRCLLSDLGLAPEEADAVIQASGEFQSDLERLASL